MLTQAQHQQWATQGYLVLPNFKPADELRAMQERAHALVEAFEPGERKAVFSTVAPKRLADEALIASSAEVHCFFEEEAFDEHGGLRQAKARSINKIGHNLHDRDDVCSRFSRDPALAELARDLGLPDARLWQSMFIFKQPHIGGEVRWHQDATFLITEPPGVVGMWFALEDATRDNGCLWVQPGGHRGPLRELFTREAEGLRLSKLDATPWPAEHEALALEVSAGALVVFDGMLPHYSAPNRSPRSRLAYTLHIADASARWSEKNWLQRGPEWPVQGFKAPGLPASAG